MQKRLENNVNKCLWRATYPDWSPAEFKTRFNQLAYDIKGCYKSPKKENHEIILRLASPHLVSVLELDNKTASSVSISISVTDDKNSAFTLVVNKKPLKSKHVQSIGLGTLPASYIKLMFHKGSPIIHINEIFIYGCRIESNEAFDETMLQVLDSKVQFKLLNS